MSTSTISDWSYTPGAVPPPEPPFHIGYRLIHTRNPDGSIADTSCVPLSEEDYLYPQEEDRFMLTNAHVLAVLYLYHAIHMALGRHKELNFKVFADHRIDWQFHDMRPHGPDLVVFTNFTKDWDDSLGTLPVLDMGPDVRLVIEVTSEATRHIDFGRKFDDLEQVGVPYYLVVDLAAPNDIPTMLAFKLERGKYQEMDYDPELGYFIPEISLWFRYQDRVIVADERGVDVLDSDQLGVKLDNLTEEVAVQTELVLTERRRVATERQRAEAANQNALAERQRAEMERQRAEMERQRAEAAEKRERAAQEQAELLAKELADLRARLNPPAN